MNFNIPMFDEETKIPSFTENVSNALRRMLRTAHDYAGDIPTDVYMYISLQSDQAAIDFLFKINGKLVEVHTLNEAGLEDHQFDVSHDRQHQLQAFIAKDLGDSFLPLFQNSKYDLPNEVWAHINTENNFPSYTLGYSLGNKQDSISESIEKWKHELEHPWDARYINLSDYPVEMD